MLEERPGRLRKGLTREVRRAARVVDDDLHQAGLGLAPRRERIPQGAGGCSRISVQGIEQRVDVLRPNQRLVALDVHHDFGANLAIRLGDAVGARGQIPCGEHDFDSQRLHAFGDFDVARRDDRPVEPRAGCDASHRARQHGDAAKIGQELSGEAQGVEPRRNDGDDLHRPSHAINPWPAPAKSVNRTTRPTNTQPRNGASGTSNAGAKAARATIGGTPVNPPRTVLGR